MTNKTARPAGASYTFWDYAVTLAGENYFQHHGFDIMHNTTEAEDAEIEQWAATLITEGMITEEV